MEDFLNKADKVSCPECHKVLTIQLTPDGEYVPPTPSSTPTLSKTPSKSTKSILQSIDPSNWK